MNNINRSTLFMILIFITLSSASALGITPSRTIVDFKSHMSQEFEFNIINNEKTDMDIIVYPRGDLAEYVTVENSNVHISASMDGIKIKYRVDLPAFPKKQGLNTIEVVAEEEASDLEDGTTIGGKLAVVHQLILKSPKSGKYATAKFSANNPGLGEDTTFAYSLFNDGEEDIDSFTADVTVFNSNSELVATSSYSFDSLAKGQSRKETRNLGIKLPPDNYHAVSKIYYGDFVMTEETDFYVLGPYVEMIGIEANNFVLKNINKIDLHIENKWSKKIDGVSADVVVRDKDGNILSTFKTFAKDIGSGERDVLSGYWDTSNIDKGSYVLNIILYFDGKVSEREFKLDVYDNRIVTSELQVTGSAITTNGKQNESVVKWLIIAFIILLIANILLIIYIKKGKNPPGQIIGYSLLFNALFLTIIIKLI